ncbi:TMV resistance protein N-like isoform X2 [Trifolium pratense]|uniref:TMV resistance protein N-like isoform X2 n=1 Tax=Trifolium pratense TaxID=57577 RepID=UPI001E695C5E|nr:TMV resistance protein N-like isoform X2 [Trifolium pratense]
MAIQSYSSSSSSFSYDYTYDVFISFRGPDTRFGFTGNLYKALSDNGIRTFIDDKELQGGEEITASLLKNIEDSRIAVIVFSKNYATSSFCLDELVHIIHHFKKKNRLVLPIFYGTKPSHVRHTNHSYGEALAKHEKKFQHNKENMNRLEEWKMALNQAANLSGYHFNLRNEEYEYVFINKIVAEISNKINRVLLHVADHPVGLESRLLQVESLLDLASDNGTCVIGIYGSGGLGKTTLTRAVYNLIADQFESLCFLHNVRQNSIKYGLEYLQEQLLSKSIGLNIHLGHVNEGIPIIKQRLHQKKVLLILDDVDKLKQLQVLVGEPSWLGPGSKVIITTRDKYLLQCHGIKRIYEVDALNEEEALELFRWMAFKNNKNDSSYDHILNRVVKYASGLPLALEVVGSNLFGKSVVEWKSTLDKYERIPHEDIQKILKVSYDALDEEQQSVFLDIACCFKGCGLAEVEEILHGHYGHCIQSHIGVLVDKSLIKIISVPWWVDKVKVTLHDLIEDMGKEIVRQESPKEPGKCSRLWFHDDIVNVLKGNTGTNKIEMIYLNCPSKKFKIDWNGEAFKKMTKLKTLIIENGHFSQGPKYLPCTLRVLKWNRYPSKSPPSSALNKEFKNMTILKFDNSKYLTNIPNVSCLPNLEIFSFKNCKNLTTVHDSIGFLTHLQILNAENCDKLLSFPPLKLISLLELELSGCTNLNKFPEILDKMENIKEITLINTGIKEFPFSFQNLTELYALFINGHGKLGLPSSILMMSNLLYVNINGFSQLLPKLNDKPGSMLPISNVKAIFLETSKHGFLNIALTWFSNVEFLFLSRSNIKILPECLKECHFLKSIDLDGCKYLEEIRGIPPNLKTLSAFGCYSLTSSSKSMLVSKELHETGGTKFYFPSSRSDKIPTWFEHQSREPSFSFSFRNNLPSLVFIFSSKQMHEWGLHKGDVDPVLRANLYINDNRCLQLLHGSLEGNKSRMKYG